MKIIVCLKEVVDTKLKLGDALANRVLLREGLPLRLNPDDMGALAAALAVKQSGVSVDITLISIGHESVETYLRDGLAAGADKAIRIWDDDFDGLASYDKALILSKAITAVGPDLILFGTRSMDTGNGVLGALTAALLGLPCVGEVISIDLYSTPKGITVLRNIGKGKREKVQVSLPATVTVKGEGKLPYAGLETFLKSRSANIPVLSLSDLGISPSTLKDSPVKISGLVFPRPVTKYVPAPDSATPTFYRILKLLEGGISKRRGLLLKGSNEELAEKIFKFLTENGVIKQA